MSAAVNLAPEGEVSFMAEDLVLIREAIALVWELVVLAVLVVSVIKRSRR
ncbi:MAG: hypothetical protein FWF11_00685 [Coriobacteriia bacterium]|nr:hypothetical protein [Coriobacteriia bacterium]